MRLILCFGLIILLVGCATMPNHYPQIVKSWQGGNARALMQRFGSPDEKIPLPTGNTLYIYKTRGYSAYATPPSPVGVSVSGTGKPVITTPTHTTWSSGSMAISCVRTFEVDPRGVIVDAKMQGSDCK